MAASGQSLIGRHQPDLSGLDCSEMPAARGGRRSELLVENQRRSPRSKADGYGGSYCPNGGTAGAWTN